MQRRNAKPKQQIDCKNLRNHFQTQIQKCTFLFTFVNEIREKVKMQFFDLLTCEQANRQSGKAGSELAEVDLQVSRKELPKNFVDLDQRGQPAEKLCCQHGSTDCSMR